MFEILYLYNKHRNVNIYLMLIMETKLNEKKKLKNSEKLNNSLRRESKNSILIIAFFEKSMITL